MINKLIFVVKKDIVSVLKPLENKNSNDIYIDPETDNFT